MLYVVIKNQTFIKKQEVNGLLNTVVIKKLLRKVPMLRDIVLKMQLYQMNDIINKCLLTGYKFIAEMHLRQPQFT